MTCFFVVIDIVTIFLMTIDIKKLLIKLWRREEGGTGIKRYISDSLPN